MTIAKLRNLSQYGVVTDVDPFNLPPEAFSMAVNARFRQSYVERAPVFRRIPVSLAYSDPRFIATNSPTTGFDSIITGYLNGRVTSYKSGSETDLSIFAYVNSDSETGYTSCHLGDVFYINRSDRVPWSLRVTDTQFQTLSNWDTNWRAKILRSCNSVLVAFGITKSGTTYPTMVKSSVTATVNTVPSSWDETVTTNIAYENILAEMESAIMDAQALGQVMVVYGLKETWIMTPVPGNDIWDVRKLFSDAGAVNVNCSVEVDHKHFVFGLNDIWEHDGVSKQSICDKKTRKNIFSTLNIQKSSRFFVKYDEARKEIRFNYVSGDRLTSFVGAEGCNRSAVYNLSEGTWTFDDLPFVFGATTSNLDNSQTYASVTTTYDTAGGSYLDQEDSLKKTLIMAGASSTTYSLSTSLYALDEQGPGSSISYPVDQNATKGVTIERDGIDLDELADGQELELEGYKVLSSLFPQAKFETGAAALMFSVGSSDNYNIAPTFLDPQSYDGVNDRRCDFNSAGRWLYLKITHTDYHWFRLTGLDLDLYVSADS
jgi:hypothetical protein